MLNLFYFSSSEGCSSGLLDPFGEKLPPADMADWFLATVERQNDEFCLTKQVNLEAGGQVVGLGIWKAAPRGTGKIPRPKHPKFEIFWLFPLHPTIYFSFLFHLLFPIQNL